MGKILVVDDERDVETLIMQRFRRAVRAGELEFLFAHDGQEALETLRARPDIDMVLSDINMPGMDGLTLLDHLPQVNADIRAVMVSAYGDLGNVRAAMNRGAFDFIIKPIDFSDLEATIHKTLEACRAVRRLRDALQETRTAEAASRAQAARLRRVLDGSPIGVSIITEAGELLYCNQRCVELFGVPAEAMQQRCSPTLFRHVLERLPDRAPGSVAPSDEIHYVREDGRTVWMAMSVDRTSYENQPVFIVWLYDITERKVQAEALRSAKESAEQALADLERMQSHLIRAEKMTVIAQLIAAVAHEINTPVGIALTAATHLQAASEAIITTFNGGQLRKSDFQDYVGTASEVSTLLVANIERAAALIQSLKLVTEGKASSPRSRVGLRDYLSDIVLAVQVQPAAAGHELVLDCPDGLALDTYPGALTEVLLALLTNAFAHAFEPEPASMAAMDGVGAGAMAGGGVDGPEDGPDDGSNRRGRVMVSVRLLGNERVELSVSDNGRGIPADIQPRLFQPFATSRRGSGSMGLGLYAVFNLVTGKLGGEIDIDSAPGHGTTVVLRLPLDAP
ncbi:PAS domain S-box protein [Azospirillum humicireducens]|uniref:histidine kinase n=1 Tax=Azospirillum humicireducens TaxID=1226968 RepID=A0A160JGG9_9PROT|nr:response regulator [Azospirillum humicireducens]ANC92058.1 PAS domain S-box protein [Azospirillum humicireducens]